MKNIIFVFLLFVVGCSANPTLTIVSQPEGAFITEKDTGNSYGLAPVTIFYDGNALSNFKTPEDCYLVKGFSAKWASGATSEINPIKLCGNLKKYYITLNRDPAHPDLEKDMQAARQSQALQIQKDSVNAAKDYNTLYMLNNLAK
jgi:hypothetical protein